MSVIRATLADTTRRLPGDYGCLGKDPLTATIAQEVERRMKIGGKRVRAYRCRCGSWHVGSKPL